MQVVGMSAEQDPDMGVPVHSSAIRCHRGTDSGPCWARPEQADAI